MLLNYVRRHGEVGSSGLQSTCTDQKDTANFAFAKARYVDVSRHSYIGVPELDEDVVVVSSGHTMMFIVGPG